jgi:uncharacterized protein (TIGR02466 family)
MSQPSPQVLTLFSTPIALVDVADGAALADDLRRVIHEQEKTHPGTQHSNLGGWQSEWDMDKWGGAATIKLLAIARNTANKVTTNRQGQPVQVPWKANIWANINRTGHGNEFHSHPSSFWSAVFYVDDGGIDADPSLGGELEFMDPRGPGPAMYAPHLAFGAAGLSVGANEVIRPKAGRLVMFPSWVLHQVRPYRGTAERISIAMNLSL